MKTHRIISTDDHLQERPGTWLDRMSSKKWGEKIPQIKIGEDGKEHWYVHGEYKRGGTSGELGSVSGALKDRAQYAPTRWADMPEISYVPAKRIDAMNEDGVDVHTFFGNVCGFGGQTFNNPNLPEDFRLEGIQAYNDFQIEEYAEPFPGRFITLAVLPMWDVALAVDEVLRTHKRGIKGITFAFPQQWGFRHIVDPYWDPLWNTAQDLALSINLHIGSAGNLTAGPMAPWDGHSDMFTLAEVSTRAISSNTAMMSTLLFSGIMDRFPNLTIVASESGLGWVPYLLEVADHQWERQQLKREGMGLRPSDYFHRQCYVNFWFEIFGTQVRHAIGIDNIMWESDFPHPTCTWPTSLNYIESSMKDWTEDERQRVLQDTPARVFHLDGNS
ncbi:amidohydrolase [Dehalococcoidia bacterium]|nr:amidohydrolase [Dehalococcoidia bacterium]